MELHWLLDDVATNGIDWNISAYPGWDRNHAAGSRAKGCGCAWSGDPDDQTLVAGVFRGPLLFGLEFDARDVTIRRDPDWDYPWAPLLAGPGDLDDDGRAELAIGWESDAGVVDIVRGGTCGEVTLGDGTQLVSADPEHEFGRQILGLPAIDGIGRDLLVTARSVPGASKLWYRYDGDEL